MPTRFIERHYDPILCAHLCEGGMLAPLARALVSRGIRSSEDLAEDWKSLLSPTSLQGLDVAAKLLADARETHRRILVVADYDCDGATACAIALRGLTAMGLEAQYLVPDRFRFGYGLSPEIVDIACQQKERPDIIITVDNGIASIEGVSHANELGIEVIITDHHLAGETLPEAAAIVDPNLPSNGFQSKALAGCGVMFYLLLALRAELRERNVYTRESQPRLDALSDLVALGTVADVVALDKNNRILVSQGLARVRQGRACPGIAALFNVAGRDYAQATARDFAFSIAPRINAAGRLTEMSIGIDCLVSDDPSQALEYARELDRLNTERRDLEGDMQLDALELVRNMDWQGRATVILFDASWHQGVVGLVASRVKEQINRPVIAFACDEGTLLKGSGRSIEGIHLKDALEAVSKRFPTLIKRFGGHAMAAGLSIEASDLERFTQAFEETIVQTVRKDVFDRRILVDGPLTGEQINFPLIDALASRIWGQGFETPLFANEFIVLDQRLVKGAHLKLRLELDGRRFDAIYFRHTTFLPSHVRLAFRPEANTYMGRRTPQIVVVADEAP